MLNDSSNVYMMFGLTGFSPCSGTSVRVLVVAAYRPSGCSASMVASTLAQPFMNIDERVNIIVLLLGYRSVARQRPI